MNLIKNERLAMSSREIADLTGKQHGHVKRDIEKMCLEINRPNLESSEYTHNGNVYTEYLLGKELTLTLVSGYNVKLRHKIIKRLDELENQAPALPQTFAEALQLAADQARKIEEQNKALEVAAPKVEFVDRYTDASGLKGFREVCKLLGVKENVFRRFLTEEGVMYRLGGKMTAYAQHIDAGRFETKTGEKEGHAYTSCKFTPKGVAWISREWLDKESYYTASKQ